MMQLWSAFSSLCANVNKLAGSLAGLSATVDEVNASLRTNLNLEQAGEGLLEQQKPPKKK